LGLSGTVTINGTSYAVDGDGNVAIPYADARVAFKTDAVLSVAICYTADRPTSTNEPFDGSYLYDLDLQALLVWDGSAWVATLGIALPLPGAAGNIAVDDGTAWQSVPMGGDVTIAADGTASVFPGSASAGSIIFGGPFGAWSTGPMSGDATIDASGVLTLANPVPTPAIAGQILVSQGSGPYVWGHVTPSGDATIDATGAVTCSGITDTIPNTFAHIYVTNGLITGWD
jgi:hypothetical protein